MFRRLVRPFAGLLALAFMLYAPLAMGQMPQPDTSQLLSSSDVSDEQVQKVARISVAVQMSTRADQMKLRKEMQQKYGNPEQMDSTKMAQARKEMRRRQMKLQKKRMRILQKEANKEGIDPKMVQRIIQSSQQDSTLQQRIRMAAKAEMKKQQQGQNPNPQNQ